MPAFRSVMSVLVSVVVRSSFTNSRPALRPPLAGGAACGRRAIAPGTLTPGRYNGRGQYHGREQASSDRPPPEEDEHRRDQQAKSEPYAEGTHPARPWPVGKRCI